MKSLLRPLGYLALAILGVGIVVILGANLYLQSSMVQERIRQATTASLGFPVEIRRVLYTPWGGLTLGNLRAMDPANPTREIFQARSLNVRFAWLPLLRKQFIITAIDLHRPILDIPQNQPFAILPPADRVEIALPPASQPVPSFPRSAEISQEAPAATEEKESSAPEEMRGPSFAVEVHSFRFVQGAIRLHDPQGRVTLEVQNLNVESHLSRDLSMRGRASAGEVILGQALHFRNVEAPFTRQEGQVSIPQFNASLAEGKINGEALITEKDFSFQAALQMEGASIPKLLEEAALPHGRTQGTLSASAKISGGTDPQSLRGEGYLVAEEATLEPLDFLRQVGQLLRISELQLLRLEEARADFQLTGLSLQLENLHLASQNLLIRSAGVVDLKGAELDLQSRLMVNEALQRNLGGLLSGFLADSEEPGYREVPFRVYGPIDNPRTDLLDRLGGGTVGREVGRFLRGLFGAPAASPKDE